MCSSRLGRFRVDRSHFTTKVHGVSTPKCRYRHSRCLLPGQHKQVKWQRPSTLSSESFKAGIWSSCRLPSSKQSEKIGSITVGRTWYLSKGRSYLPTPAEQVRHLFYVHDICQMREGRGKHWLYQLQDHFRSAGVHLHRWCCQEHAWPWRSGYGRVARLVRNERPQEPEAPQLAG